MTTIRSGLGRVFAWPFCTVLMLVIVVVPSNDAQTVTYDVTGEVTIVGDMDFVADTLDPALLKIPEIGDPFTMRFTLDFDAVLTSFSTGVATYGLALLDVTMSLPDSGIVHTASSAPVTTQNDAILFGQDVTDVWQTDLIFGSGLDLFTLPISDGFGAIPDATVSEAILRLEDIGSPNIFTTSPAPLEDPGDPAWSDEIIFEFTWEDLFGLSPHAQGVVTSITLVPEPGSAILAAGLAGLVWRRRR